MAVAGHTHGRYVSALHRLQQRAAGFVQMLAVAKAAKAKQRAKLDKAFKQLVVTDMRQAELADAGRVDQVAAVRKMKQPGRGGGVSAPPLKSV